MASARSKSHVPCPHCGFQNFAISAYCGRCERPLRSGTPNLDDHDRLTVPAESPTPARPTPVASERLTPPPESKPRSRLVRPPLAAVPPPEPPHVEPARPAPLPIEITKSQRKKARRRAKTQRQIEFSVSLATPLRLLIGQAIDLVLIVGVGLAIIFGEALLFDEPVRQSSTGLLDQMANWVHAHSGPALHGLVVAMAFGLGYSLFFCRGSGRTPGRALTGTVLVRASAKPMTWPVIAIRTAAVILSVAAFGAGFFWAIVDRRGRTWHDIIAGTIVVKRHLRPTTPRSSGGS